MKHLCSVVVAFVLLLSSRSMLLAQAATGELSITITDSSGAVVKDAEVTVKGTDTGAVARVLKTNDQGIAQMPLLQPGRYDSHIVASGFKTVDRNGWRWENRRRW
ncbi:MAG: carboxypeptidase regulatory-like domain-containing protein [Acidobacteriales bacterium]|nr:carboxypeptidase regulatory-like domain-containing protein [Terriglobales bacterium]